MENKNQKTNKRLKGAEHTENPVFREKVWYQKEIVEMVNLIDNEKYLKMIYWYIGSAYKEEKEGVPKVMK